MDTLTQKRLKELLDYDPETGVFVWKSARKGVRVGAVAGSKQTDGYFAIRINGKSYKSHRLAWLFVCGMWPKNDIDHIDHHRANNCFANLRNVTRSENLQNQIKARIGSIGGSLGVTLHKCGKYHARIHLNGKCKSLGLFNTKSDAHTAYVIAKRAYHQTCTL